MCVCERRRRTVGRRDAETRQTEESYGSRLSAPDDGRRPGDVFAFAFSYPGSSPPPCPKRKEGRGGGGSLRFCSLSSVLYTCPPSLVTQPQKAQAVSPPASLLFRSVRPPSPHSLSLSLSHFLLCVSNSLSLSRSYHGQMAMRRAGQQTGAGLL